MFQRKKWRGAAAGVALAIAGPLVLTACGGAQHGKVSGLSANEMSDLITYLQSI